MHAFLSNLIPKLKSHSQRLDNLALFVDQPWVQIGGPDERVLYVFRGTGGELLVVRNGAVMTHRWEFLPYINGMLVEADGKKTLYNQGFLDEAFMVLGVDGRPEYLLLANESKASERTVERVLARLTEKYLAPSPPSRPGVVTCYVCGMEMARSEASNFNGVTMCRPHYLRAIL